MKIRKIDTATVIEMFIETIGSEYEEQLSDVLSYAEDNALARIAQDASPYNNLYLLAFKLGDVLLVYEGGNEGRFYQVGGCDNYNALVRQMAAEWANNSTDTSIDYQLEMCRWGLATIHDYAADPLDGGACAVVVQTHYYDSRPVRIIADDHLGNIVWYDSYEDARRYIADAEANVYHLSNGEAGRPEYAIWGE